MGILDVDSQLSLVCSHLSCITWGPTCRLYPWTRELAVAIFHDVITYQAGCRRTDSVSILVYMASYGLVVGRSGRFSQIAGFLIGIARRRLDSVWAQQYADWWPYWDSGRLLAGRVACVLNSLRLVIFWSLGWREVAVGYIRRWLECATFSVWSFSAFVSSCYVPVPGVGRRVSRRQRIERTVMLQCTNIDPIVSCRNACWLRIINWQVAEENGVVVHNPLALTHTFLPRRPAYPEAWRQYATAIVYFKCCSLLNAD